MKDKAIEEQNHLREGKPATMEEVNALHDEWWNSLTNKQKSQLVEQQAAIEKQISLERYGC